MHFEIGFHFPCILIDVCLYDIASYSESFCPGIITAVVIVTVTKSVSYSSTDVIVKKNPKFNAYPLFAMCS